MVRKRLSRTKGKRSRYTGHLERRRKMKNKTSQKSRVKTKKR